MQAKNVAYLHAKTRTAITYLELKQLVDKLNYAKIGLVKGLLLM